MLYMLWILWVQTDCGLFRVTTTSEVIAKRSSPFHLPLFVALSLTESELCTLSLSLCQHNDWNICAIRVILFQSFTHGSNGFDCSHFSNTTTFVTCCVAHCIQSTLVNYIIRYIIWLCSISIQLSLMEFFFRFQQPMRSICIFPWVTNTTSLWDSNNLVAVPSY